MVRLTVVPVIPLAWSVIGTGDFDGDGLAVISVSTDAQVDFGWPTSGDRLVAEFIFATKVQVASWQPGATRLAVTTISPGHDQAALVVG